MITLAILISANALWILGFHAATRKGMLLPLEGWWEKSKWKPNPDWDAWKVRLGKAEEKVKQLMEMGENLTPSEKWSWDQAMKVGNELREKLHEVQPPMFIPPRVSKPLSECPTCMASIHGLLWAVPAIITLGLPFWVAAPWVVCLAGLVEVLAGLAWKGGGEG